MQAVDVLGDESELVSALLEARQSTVAGVRLEPCDHLAAPVVPFPDKFRVAGERSWRGQVFGSVTSPQAACAAEGRNAAFGRYSGARERGDSRGRSQQIANRQ